MRATDFMTRSKSITIRKAEMAVSVIAEQDGGHAYLC